MFILPLRYNLIPKNPLPTIAMQANAQDNNGPTGTVTITGSANKKVSHAN